MGNSISLWNDRHMIEKKTVLWSFNFMLSIFISIISGFRFKSGDDYEAYETIYNIIKEIDYDIVFEPLYFILVKVMSGFEVSNFIIALITNLVVLLAFRKLRLKPVSYIIYTLSIVYLSQFNIVRQSLSTAFIFLFYAQAANNSDSNYKARKYAYALMAISSHYMSFLVITFNAVVKNITFSTAVRVVILIIVFVLAKLNIFNDLFVFVVSYFPEKYSNYIGIEYGRTFGGKFLLESIVYICFELLIKNKDHRLSFISNVMFLGLLIAFISTTIPILFRLSYFYYFSFVIYYSLVLESGYYKNDFNRKVATVFILIYTLFSFSVSLANNVFGIFPYGNVLASNFLEKFLF